MAQARGLVAKLRAESPNPIAYVELSSARSESVVNAIETFTRFRLDYLDSKAT